jgi:hypothetical protein
MLLSGRCGLSCNRLFKYLLLFTDAVTIINNT